MRPLYIKILLFCSLLLGIFTIIYYIRNPLTPKVKIGEFIFSIELAVTSRVKERGLGYRAGMKENHGMLFVYDHKEKYPFWMKGMRFPLDFIWIDGSTIVDITKNVPIEPEVNNDYFTTYASKFPVDKILEVNAGTVDRYGIVIGQTVQFLD